MKTKILTIVALMTGGLIFSSCQKDNSLIDDASASLTKSVPSALEDANSNDLIGNYPDPFTKGTTIYYEVETAGWVTLSVYGENLNWIGELVDKYQPAGKYTVKFDASNLPPGKYIARLTTGSKVYKELMTKKPLLNWENNDPFIPVDTK